MIFPDDRTESYELGFVCGPDHPAVEHDVRRFLDTIEEEFKACESLRSECSDRWRGLVIPGRVNRDNIHGYGYRYGEYRFTLDQDNVLQLLMGENLYDSPFVFVRELLQNAIDASRLRQHLERTRSNAPYEVRPIHVSQWIDSDRYHWVRFDDYGTGMDEFIIREHLLKVGSSYYNSSQYKADILKASRKGARDFAPISRFGIGLLSCFIACDRVEISTLRQHPSGTASEPIRLSLVGLSGYFSLQTPKLPPALMPSANRSPADDEYRTEFGTSIACRLDPTKERGEFDLAGLLRENLFCPLVPVEFEGESIGGNFKRIIETPWCQRETLKLTPGQLDGMTNITKWPIKSDDVSIEIIPIDLSGNTISEDFRGQVVFIKFRYPDEMQAFGLAPLNLEVGLNATGFSIGVNARVSEREVDRIEEKARDLPDKGLGMKLMTWCGQIRRAIESQHFDRGDDSVYSATTSIPLPQSNHILGAEIRSLFASEDRLKIMHNGISIPTRSADTNVFSSYTTRLATNEVTMVAIGALGLQDGLRPNLSLARDRVKSWPWEVISTADLILSRVLRQLDDAARFISPANLLTINAKEREYLTMGRLMRDPLLSAEGLWAEQRIFLVGYGEYASLVEIKQKLADGIKIELLNLHSPSELNGAYSPWGWRTAATALAAAHLDLTYLIEEYRGKIIAIGVRSKPLQEGERLFPPTTFMPYVASNVLRHSSSILNRDHPFAMWLIKSAPIIAEQYPGIIEMIRSKILVAPSYGRDKESVVESVNSAVERLAQLDPALKPPKNAKLTEQNFSVKF